MTMWVLSVRKAWSGRVDASPIWPDRFRHLGRDQIERVVLQSQGRRVPLGDVFDVSIDDAAAERIDLVGETGWLDHVGGKMRGGEVCVRGDAGHHVGSPSDGARVGMSGGRLVIAGNVGSHAGHRTRRGEIWIAGDAGPMMATHMVAGTIVVGGRVGASDADHLAAGMRRGTVLLASEPVLPRERFTEPVEAAYPFASLLNVPDEVASLAVLVDRLRRGVCRVRRGDRAIGGQGEIVYPADSMV